MNIPTTCSDPDCQSRLHHVSDNYNGWMEKYLAGELTATEEEE